MSYIIDRRLNGKNKSMVNRQRFLRRYRGHIKDAVQDAVNRRSITDMDRGEQISIPTKNTHEPRIGHGQGGRQHRVYPGNKEFNTGDELEKPRGGGGGQGSGQASNQGEGEEDFTFAITREEFLNYLFDDLALPNMVKQSLARTKNFKTRRAGFVSEGTPNNLSVVKSMRNAHARRIGMGAGKRRKLKELEAALADAENRGDSGAVATLKADIADLQRRLKKIPFLDDIDLRYRNQVKVPMPTSKAVMFCLMDVSGSMTQDVKDMAKRFYLLLYLFLERNYEQIEIVFIRHHTSAKEVSEEEFFYSRETGGTIVSSALKLTLDTIKARYPVEEWNLYGAQASDGDNWNDDSPICRDLLVRQIMPAMQYYCYVEITPREHQTLWHEYEAVAEHFADSFAQQQIVDAGDIYPVFGKLFQKRMAT
ncbi:YeaH/YhbH family protein [Thalassolituus sp. UBA2107]|uniref:YeaH/YhbH family protein n=1 Tax=Thalassolituus sp. UBA2107 TaxID=1947659 RepID=UPI0026495EEE|nr:YeaH/YhbH family protein [Thalassolituus sp. UBA2107]